MTYCFWFRAAVLSVVALSIGACDNAAETDSNAPTTEELACLRDVPLVANTPDVALLKSEASEAGTIATVGVGDLRAPWRCTGYADGTTDNIESLSDEGLL